MVFCCGCQNAKELEHPQGESAAGKVNPSQRMESVSTVDLPKEGRALARVLALHPSSQEVACGLSDGTVYIYGWKGKEAAEKLSGQRNELLNLSFTADGSRLFGISEDGSLLEWRWPSRETAQHERIASNRIEAATTSADGQLVAYAIQGEYGSNTTLVKRISDNKVLHSFEGYSTIMDLAFSRDSSLLVLGYADNVQIATLADGKVWWRLSTPELRGVLLAPIYAVTISNDKQLLCLGTAAGEMARYVIGLGQKKGVRIDTGVGSEVDVSFMPTSSDIVFGAKDPTGSVGIWSGVEGKRPTVQGTTKDGDFIVSVAAGNQKVFSTVSLGGTIRIWDIQPQRDSK